MQHYKRMNLEQDTK